MLEKAKDKTAEGYRAIGANCVDAVASVLIAGSLNELTDYKTWITPTPGMLYTALWFVHTK